MLECETAIEVWTILNNLFSSRNLARVIELKSKLENLKKGNLSLKDYFLKVKNLTNALATAGKQISKEDHIMHLLAGLGVDFDATVSVISAGKDTPTLQEVYSLLLAQEGRNERNSTKINQDASLPSVNLTMQEPQRKGNTLNYTDNKNNWNTNRGRGNNRTNSNWNRSRN